MRRIIYFSILSLLTAAFVAQAADVPAKKQHDDVYELFERYTAEFARNMNNPIPSNILPNIHVSDNLDEESVDALNVSVLGAMHVDNARAATIESLVEQGAEFGAEEIQLAFELAADYLNQGLDDMHREWFFLANWL